MYIVNAVGKGLYWHFAKGLAKQSTGTHVFLVTSQLCTQSVLNILCFHLH